MGALLLVMLLTAILLQLIYIGLIWGVVCVLPATETSRRLMQWGYWSSVGFVFCCWLAYALSGWLIRFPTFFIVIFIGSGWLAGVRQRLGLVEPHLNGWAALHRWVCLPFALVIAQWWFAYHWYKPAYHDNNVTVGVTEDFVLSSTNTLVFLRNRNALFEVETGRIGNYFPDGNVYWRRDWWGSVRAVTVDMQARTVTICKPGQRPITLSFQP
jgi:hypothetical protein